VNLLAHVVESGKFPKNVLQLTIQNELFKNLVDPKIKI
jgi:hypothetical protein